ncbi:uncharacterized protein LACBIDRAFT_307465 [Laccaria bicolor S238N-H82]|uniref:Predicted protein n=1 Tax=Laccaria bicolor (strain S238N-H82 / ATCC MYA-4686) TaxID=486041 RepID=B0DQ78_LACBS|nr:uncharacterized protein LACBIDRAFT_307465 [Laccaria bicolor S238N-H82]EDR03245.1 predicted protein [Laccaria bicolor S238N-H82]|eukprot:XP_001886041.1 predicted protein [Laccaria bicolor S238N-H82]
MERHTINNTPLGRVWMLVAGTAAGELTRWCVIPESMIYVVSCMHCCNNDTMASDDLTQGIIYS